MRKLLLMALLPLFAIGCASTNIEYPRATLYPSSTQQKMQAAEHWNVLAANEAKLITSKLSSSPVIHISCNSASCTKGGRNSSPFAEAYNEFLTSHLVNNGARVAISKESDSYTLEYHVQVVSHTDRSGLPLKPGTLTGGYAAAYGIYQAAENWSNGSLIALPLAVAGDLYLQNVEETDASNSEVLVTTKITKGNRVIVSNSHIYYFNAGDASHYTNKAKAKGFSVTNVN